MDEQVNGGAILIARQVFESEIFMFKPAIWFKIWIYILGHVFWKDKGKLKRGQGYFKYDWIKGTTGATQDQVKHCIEYLKASHMIATQKATRGMVVTVLKYDEYQNMNTYKSHTESQLEATQKPHRSHTNKEERKKVKKESNKHLVVQVINHLNEKAEKDFKPNSKATIKFINARLAEKYTLEDFIHVIDIKCEQWKDDPERNLFLRPSTLFNSEKFEGYVNEKKITSKPGRTKGGETPEQFTARMRGAVE